MGTGSLLLTTGHRPNVSRPLRDKRRVEMAEEEDYMGDLSQFIPPEASSPPKSSSKKANSKAISSSSSNKKVKTSNWQEQRKLKREQKQIEEDHQTLANLETALPQSNIGFKMLKQMGYTPGSALGKEGSGRAEPVRLEIRRSRAGIGKEDPRVETITREKEKEKEERKRRTEEELMMGFGCRQKERWKGRKILVNFWKAEAALVQLENREVVEAGKKEDENEDKEEEEEEQITDEDLNAILMKLRDEYHYCLFCGYQYESKDALLASCPGVHEDDH